MILSKAQFKALWDAAHFRNNTRNYTKEEVNAFIHGLVLMGITCNVDESQLKALQQLKRKD